MGWEATSPDTRRAPLHLSSDQSQGLSRTKTGQRPLPCGFTAATAGRWGEGPPLPCQRAPALICPGDSGSAGPLHPSQAYPSPGLRPEPSVTSKRPV